MIMTRRSQRTGMTSQTMAPALSKTTSLEVVEEGEEVQEVEVEVVEEGRGGNPQPRSG